MAVYPLKDLLKVRKLREDKALEAVMAAQRKLEEALRYLEAQKEALRSYHQFRLQEENRLYSTIIGKTVARSRVDEVLAEIAHLRNEELMHEKRVSEAQKNLETAQKDLDLAKKAHRDSIKNRQKIEEHRDIWLEEFKKEQEFFLEKELEDFRVREKEKDDFDYDTNVA